MRPHALEGLSMNPRVLVVEDDVDVRTMMAELLGLYGYAVAEASTAAAGLSALSSESFAVALVDYELPDQSGVDLLQEARKRGLLGNTGAALVTAHPNPRGLPGVPLVRKPFEIDAFLGLVEQLAQANSSRAA